MIFSLHRPVFLLSTPASRFSTISQLGLAATLPSVWDLRRTSTCCTGASCTGGMRSLHRFTKKVPKLPSKMDALYRILLKPVILMQQRRSWTQHLVSLAGCVHCGAGFETKARFSWLLSSTSNMHGRSMHPLWLLKVIGTPLRVVRLACAAYDRFSTICFAWKLHIWRAKIVLKGFTSLAAVACMSLVSSG